MLVSSAEVAFKKNRHQVFFSDPGAPLISANEVLSLPHKFRSEPVRTDQIPIGNFQVEYLPNKQRTPSFFSDWIPIRKPFLIGSGRTESNHVLTGSKRIQSEKLTLVSRYTN